MAVARPNYDYAYSLARAFGGAIIFALPLLMTMEMWSIGLYVHPLRLLLFLAANFVVLVFLSRFGGFERTANLREDVLDALAAYAVGIASSAAILGVFGLLSANMALDELVGIIAIQAVPGSFGAMIARKQLTGGDPDEDEEKAARSAGYAGQLFLMLAGALFLAFNVAPTEEMVLIGYKMSAWHSLALMLLSLFLLHVLVFAVGFAGQEEPEGFGILRRFLVFTVPGYAIALAVSFYVLWTFGRVDGNALAAVAETVVVLGFPAAIGAAIARLVV
ncbi:TIGR02587 family membrane protein [Sphingomonas psychrotolerans]|uniref:TIGR02587 family membrane protein n=1 Tax=Sphingomonas psychrotolerans TaxID=1327635 RepID=A0ABU3N1T9_9SPHN|nr:TIGR02587 family membrane protein [Sphingomonas psychrotolerans]MDT8758201.1 TIGR02587 family membrane protein [Sphingomonas psychrotolerans]